MTHYSIEDIRTLAAIEPSKALRLHWEGDEAEAAQVTPDRILSDIRDGDYSVKQFDEIGYCVSEEDYQEEQGQGE